MNKQKQTKNVNMKVKHSPRVRLCECFNCGHRFSTSQKEPYCPKCYSDDVDFVNPKNV